MYCLVASEKFEVVVVTMMKRKQPCIIILYLYLLPEYIILSGCHKLYFIGVNKHNFFNILNAHPSKPWAQVINFIELLKRRAIYLYTYLHINIILIWKWLRNVPKLIRLSTCTIIYLPTRPLLKIKRIYAHVQRVFSVFYFRRSF